MQNINSDQLRKRLAKHTRKMNWLAEQNDLIVATLKQRGLQAVEKTADEDLVFSADKMILTNADGTEVFNTDWPNPLANPGLRANSKAKSPFSEEHSKAVHRPMPEELSVMFSSFFKGFGHVRVGNTGGEVLIDTEWPNPFVSPDLPSPVINPESNRKIALTADELKAGGWWCADVSEECRLALIVNGASVTSYRWIGSENVQCAYKPDSESNVLRAHQPVDLDILKQIHRIGNNFYWGAPNG